MKKFVLIFLLSLACHSSYSQHIRCSTMEYREKRLIENPVLRNAVNNAELLMLNVDKSSRVNANIISIPVVVHVIWNLSVQNISDAQIQSQIKILNDDFRLLNKDSLKSNHPFWPFTSDTEIEFCLAKKDPNGNATTGITRTQTSVVEWDDFNSDDLKYTSLGGKDNWDPTKYLNIYVANLQDGLLGFATFPDELSTNPDLDGVVIRPEAFGNTGTAGTGGYSANNLGRTATHEIGHWLFLYHIWGDEPCGNDLINDTPVAEAENYNCPTFPRNPNNSCGAGANGEMYMNYMDYVDDNCMKMFTAGQKTRMRNAITQFRSGLLSSTACGTNVGLNMEEHNHAFSLYPNPTQNNFSFNIEFNNSLPTRLCIVDVFGRVLMTIEEDIQQKMKIELENILNKGIYFIRSEFTDKRFSNQKLIIE